MLHPFTSKPKHYTTDCWKEYQRIIKSFKDYKVPENQQQWALEALHDELTWFWYDECNGANIVDEDGWEASIITNIAYHPAYVYHDYAWERWGASWLSNQRMYLLQNTYKMNRIKSYTRWLGVSFVGMPCYYIKNLFLTILFSNCKETPITILFI